MRPLGRRAPPVASFAGAGASSTGPAQLRPLSLDALFVVLSFVSMAEHRTLLCVCKSWRAACRRVQRGFVCLAEACALKRQRSALVFKHMWDTAAPLLGDNTSEDADRLMQEVVPHGRFYAYPTSEPPSLSFAVPPVGDPYRALALQYFDTSGSELNTRNEIWEDVHGEFGQVCFAPCGLLALAEACEWALSFAHLLFDLFEYPEGQRSACALGQVWDRIDRGECPSTSVAAFSASLLRPVPVLARRAQLDGSPLNSGISFADRMQHHCRWGAWRKLFVRAPEADGAFDEAEATSQALGLKVAALRAELAALGQGTEGTKPMLVPRLVNAQRAAADAKRAAAAAATRAASPLPYADRHATFLHHWLASAAEHERCRSLPPAERIWGYFQKKLPPPPAVDLERHDPNWLIICTAFLPAFASQLAEAKLSVDRDSRLIRGRHVLATLHRSPTLSSHPCKEHLDTPHMAHATLAWPVFGAAAAAGIEHSLSSRQSEICEAAIRQGLTRVLDANEPLLDDEQVVDTYGHTYRGLRHEVRAYVCEIGCAIEAGEAADESADEESWNDDESADEESWNTEDDESDSDGESAGGEEEEDDEEKEDEDEDEGFPGVEAADKELIEWLRVRVAAEAPEAEEDEAEE